ncbi:arabinofuranosyltransferase [Acrocarpospora sp. B8E8]|uniref:arabinofuranosyltransferase n=1 Tax=Acrocarpospora sp. B8E8 TaxID=3153572 RepID=UPI00325DB914
MSVTLAETPVSTVTDQRAPRFSGGTIAALAVWAAGSALALVLPRWLDLSPLSIQGAALPLAVGGLVIAVVVAVAARWPGRADLVGGAAAGLLAAWVLLTLRTALYGTPHGFGTLAGDMGRMSAMATRFSETLANGDPLGVGVPSEYPPLFPWLIGRASALSGVPAWRLLGYAEMISMSVAVIAAYLLWRRLVSAPVALAVTVAGLAGFHDPAKAFVVVTIAAFVPWTLQTLWTPPAGRLNWLVAGVIGGLIVCTYLGPFMLCSFGLLALLALLLRGPDRSEHLRHLLKVIAVTVVVSGWYLLPYAITILTKGGQTVQDLYPTDDLLEPPPPFGSLSPLSALQIVGLAGVLWYRRAAWWATPMLCLIAGLYVYRAVMLARFTVDGHTMFAHYTTRMLGPILAVCGVLTITMLAGALARRLARPLPRGLGLAGVAVLVIWTMFTAVGSWMPNRDALTGAAPNSAAVAHLQPFPDGRLPRFAVAEHALDGFPAAQVARAVARTLPADRRPVTLAVDERLFASVPWPGYVAVDRTAANSMARWDDRHAEVARLAATLDPAAFAAASTAFGTIDVFVLWNEGDVWSWKDVNFRPAQFDPTIFAITKLPGGLVVATRKG